jgi:hypothetical protein
MMNVGSMAFSDAIILETLQRLIEAHGEDQVFTQERISEASGVCLITTKRALRRLVLSERLTVNEPTRNQGRRYRIINGSTSQSPG